MYLGAAEGTVVPRNELLDNVWPRMTVTSDALSQCVVELRRAFGDDCPRPHIIETIPRIGLRLMAPVSPLSAVPLARTTRVSARQVPQWRRWAVAIGLAAVVVAAALL